MKMNKNLLYAAALGMAGFANVNGSVDVQEPKKRKPSNKDRSKAKAARKQSRKNRGKK